MSQPTLCSTLGIERPVLLAPMGNIAGGALAKAVSDSGGFGLIGGGYGDPTWIADQMAIAGKARIGIGLITWNMADGAVEAALAHSPVALWLSFGDPAPYINLIHQVAAGGINDASGLAAASALGADGVCVGTAFYGTQLKDEYNKAVLDDDMSVRVVWAGSGLDGVTAIVPAAEVVGRFAKAI